MLRQKEEKERPDMQNLSSRLGTLVEIFRKLADVYKAKAGECLRKKQKI